MVKEIAIGKRAKISEAQQYMLFSVLGAAIFLGAAISLVSHFIQRISFNTNVIMEEEKAIVDYSNVIMSTGICKKPRGSVYSDKEIEDCDPDAIRIDEIPDTLRANILENLASNEALNSVPKEDDSNCINPDTGKSFTYKELDEKYENASSTSELKTASQLIKSCSALRVIPDALPAKKNEEALLASLNKLFIISGWEPESLSPSGSSSSLSEDSNLNTISVSLSVEANTATTMTVLNNIERSIREFNIEHASIEWGSDDTLILQAQASAFYNKEASITENRITIEPEGNNNTYED